VPGRASTLDVYELLSFRQLNDGVEATPYAPAPSCSLLNLQSAAVPRWRTRWRTAQQLARQWQRRRKLTRQTQVLRPTDLKNLCLVCKQLHELAVRQLYHEVTLDVGSSNDTRLGAFLSSKNIGLQYVRKLDLYLADVLDKCNQLQQANFAIRMILELLPENILEKFSWHPWSPFSGENLVLLYKKQKRMKWLEGIALEGDCLVELQKIPEFEKVFENVRKLGLYPYVALWHFVRP
jgi:hypothetical protein